MQCGGQINKKNLGLLLALNNLTYANLRKSDLCSIPKFLALSFIPLWAMGYHYNFAQLIFAAGR